MKIPLGLPKYLKTGGERGPQKGCRISPQSLSNRLNPHKAGGRQTVPPPALLRRCSGLVTPWAPDRTLPCPWFSVTVRPCISLGGSRPWKGRAQAPGRTVCRAVSGTVTLNLLICDAGGPCRRMAVTPGTDLMSRQAGSLPPAPLSRAPHVSFESLCAFWRF